MMKTILRALVLLCALTPFAAASSAFAQTKDPSPAASKLEDIKTEDIKAEDTETMAKLIALRDAFIKQIVTEGFSCPIKPPAIVLQPTPSFGNYNEDENTVFSPAWHQLGPDEKALFHTLAGPNAEDAAARQTFEGGAHRWIFIHELGHWWQACKKVDRATDHYMQEYEADRIAAAYWKQADPAFLARMYGFFHHMYDAGPNPVPEGADAEKFFNENYGEALAKTNAYPWFQARMIVGVDAEKPAATFAQALRETGK